MQRRTSASRQSQCEAKILAALHSFDLPAYKIHRAIGGRFSADDFIRGLRALMGSGAILEVGQSRRGGPIYGRRGRRREH
jgi:hypothetical protein